jgi:hypothetical protein
VILRFYHFLFYCYYNLVGPGARKPDGACSLLSVFDVAILFGVYVQFYIRLGKGNVFEISGLTVFIVGVILSVVNWLYFVRYRKFVVAKNEAATISRRLVVSCGVVLLILPLIVFIYSGITFAMYRRGEL